jgi:hypothetical protein
MTDTLNKALAEIREWHATHKTTQDLSNYHHGQRVVELGGDGSVLIIAGFERTGHGEYKAKCLKLGTSEVPVIPVSRLKPEGTTTIH